MGELSEMTLFEQGGPVMYPLLLVSIFGLAYVLYCLFALRRRVIISAPLLKIAETLSPDEKDCAKAEDICRSEGGPFGEILLLVIRSRKLGQAESEQLVEGAGRRAAHDLSRGTLALEIVAAVSPLLGLLGTVTGMYNLLTNIKTAGSQEMGVISGGIAEALITTIAGLIIAIPAYVAFSYFSRRVDDLALVMEEYAEHLMARLRGASEEGE